jgi:tetratricopeptide (TPR) repeat protein
MDRLEPEHDNLRAALAAIASLSGDADLRLGASLGKFWCDRGRLSEGAGWLDAALAAHRAPTALRGQALWQAAEIAWRRGLYHEARPLLEEAHEIAQQLGEVALAADAGALLGVVLHSVRRYAEARAAGEEALGLARELGDPVRLHLALWALATTLYYVEEFAISRALLEEQIELTGRLGDRIAQSRGMRVLGLVELRQNGPAAARTLLERAFRVRWQDGAMALVCYSLEDFAVMAAMEGEPDRALRLIGAAQQLRRSLGASPVPPWGDERDELLLPARRELGPRAVRLEQEGARMQLDDAVAYALDQVTGTFAPSAGDSS